MTFVFYSMTIIYAFHGSRCCNVSYCNYTSVSRPYCMVVHLYITYDLLFNIKSYKWSLPFHIIHDLSLLKARHYHCPFILHMVCPYQKLHKVIAPFIWHMACCPFLNLHKVIALYIIYNLSLSKATPIYVPFK